MLGKITQELSQLCGVDLAIGALCVHDVVERAKKLLFYVPQANISSGKTPPRARHGGMYTHVHTQNVSLEMYRFTHALAEEENPLDRCLRYMNNTRERGHMCEPES